MPAGDAPDPRRDRVGRVEYLTADLSSQADIRRLAQGVRNATDRLDVLVNNAGGIYLKREVTVDGVEMTFALNHLAYFLLTNLLLDLIKASAPARIVSVASAAHQGWTIQFDDLQGKGRYSGWRAYQQSKLANILFTRELARRLEGTGVTANALHPGLREDPDLPGGWRSRLAPPPRGRPVRDLAGTGGKDVNLSRQLARGRRCHRLLFRQSEARGLVPRPRKKTPPRGGSGKSARSSPG